MPIFVLAPKVGALGEAKRQVIVILIARSFTKRRRIRRRSQGENRPAIKPKYQTLRVYIDFLRSGACAMNNKWTVLGKLYTPANDHFLTPVLQCSSPSNMLSTERRQGNYSVPYSSVPAKAILKKINSQSVDT